MVDYVDRVLACMQLPNNSMGPVIDAIYAHANVAFAVNITSFVTDFDPFYRRDSPKKTPVVVTEEIG